MENTNNKSAKIIRFGKFRYLAAGGIFALILTMCFLPLGQNGSFFAVLEDKLSQTLELFSVRGAEGETDKSMSELKKCMQTYNSKDYAAATTQFESFVATYPKADNIDEAKLYMGVSYLNIGNAEKANQVLYRLSEKDGFAMQDDAKWYLGFSYIYLRDVETAKDVFKSLANSKTYSAQVSAMLAAKEKPQSVVFK